MIANPTILTSNHIKANIESGQEVPYQQGALSGGTSVVFKKAVMQLAVTPDVVNKQNINLSIQVHQDKVTPATVNGVPIISTEQLNTHAIINNHNLLMLGGIIEKIIVSKLKVFQYCVICPFWVCCSSGIVRKCALKSYLSLFSRVGKLCYSKFCCCKTVCTAGMLRI